MRFGLGLVGVGLVGGALSVGACSGGQSHAEDPQVAIHRAGESLKGEWVLVHFEPSTPLEPMLDTMLRSQFGQLIVSLDGASALAHSDALHIQRRYQIDAVDGERIEMTLLDEHGIAYQVTAEPRGDQLRFRARTPPWMGEGTLARAR